MLALEVMLVVKFGRGLYPKPLPKAVLGSWAVAVVVCVALLIVWQLRMWRKAASVPEQQQQQQTTNPVLQTPTSQGKKH